MILIFNRHHNGSLLISSPNYSYIIVRFNILNFVLILRNIHNIFIIYSVQRKIMKTVLAIQVLMVSFTLITGQYFAYIVILIKITVRSGVAKIYKCGWRAMSKILKRILNN